MITGTGRSGTSMWMQVLAAAGVPVIGEAFPPGWEGYRAANPRGFHESSLVDGIGARSRIDPVTGRSLEPAEVRGVAVKVLAAGVPVTQLAFLDAVVVSIRHWRAHADSVQRAGPVIGRGDGDPRVKWWLDHWNLVLDQRTRGYRCRFVPYEQVVRDPELVRDVLRWIGVPHDADAGARAVEPALDRAGVSDLPEPAWTEALDALYRAAVDGTLGAPFLDRWADTHRAIAASARGRSRWR